MEEAYGDQIRQRKAVLVPVGDSFRLVDLQTLSPDDKDLLLQKIFPGDGEDLGIVAKIRGRMERYDALAAAVSADHLLPSAPASN